MNIFVLDASPLRAAEMHCDKHVPKMVLETAQIMSTVLNEKGLKGAYKSTHKNHPCTVWAGQSFANYMWTMALGMALGLEYEKRFGRTHKSADVIWEMKDTPIRVLRDAFDQDEMTDWVLAMPDEYKCRDAVHSYREYYRGAKAHFARWDRGETPEWWAQ